MLKNYFQVALRGLWKSTFYSTLNLVVIAIGISFCLLVLIWCLPGILGLGVCVFMAVSIQVILTALSNPVLSLRND